MGDYAEIRDNLEALFLAVRGDAASRLRALGIPLDVAETQTTVTRNAKDPNGWQSSDAVIQRSVLTNRNIPFPQLAPLLSRNTASEVNIHARQHVLVMAEPQSTG